MRVLVTRAPPDAARTVSRLANAGHEAVLAPVLKIEPSRAALPPGPFTALLATSAHAFAAFRDKAADSLTARPLFAAADSLKARPLFAVGDATAAAARAAGFRDTRVSLGDAAALAALVRLTLPRPARILFLCGQDRKPTLEAALAGYDLVVHEAYAAVAEADWPEAAVAALSEGRVAAALHFSRRSAALTLALAERHGLSAPVLALRHLCLSDDVAAPLRDAGAARVEVASDPTEAALLARLDPPAP